MHSIIFFCLPGYVSSLNTLTILIILPLERKKKKKLLTLVIMCHSLICLSGGYAPEVIYVF